MFGLRKRGLPSADDALPGRAERMPVPETHFVLGTPLEPPFPDGHRRALCSAWAASGARSGCSGSCRASTRPRSGYAGGHHAEPDLRGGLQRAAPGHTEVVRVVFDPATMSLRRPAAASSGRTTTRPRACGRATTSAPSTARPSTVSDPAQRAAAEASRDAYQAALDGGGLRRRSRPRSSPAGPVLLRRGLPPAVPGQEPGRLLRHRRHRRDLPDRRGASIPEVAGPPDARPRPPRLTRGRRLASAARPAGRRSHPRARRPLLHAPARRHGRPRHQDRAPRRRRRDAPQRAPARARARRSEQLLRARQRGQGERGGGSLAPRRTSRGARPGPPRRRLHRELRARRGRPSRPATTTPSAR